MAYLTDETMQQLARDVARKETTLARITEKAKERNREVAALFEVAAGTLAFSYVDAAYSDDGEEYKLMGVPLSLAAAVGLHALGWSDWAGKYSRDAHNLGTGALATWLATLGRSLGKQQRSGGRPGRHAVAGYETGALPPGMGGGPARYVVSEMPAPGY
jgi:hypothetical protein